MSTFDHRVETYSLASNMNTSTEFFFGGSSEDLYTVNKSELEFYGIMEDTNIFNDASLDPFFPSTQHKSNQILSLENEQLRQKLYAFYLILINIHLY